MPPQHERKLLLGAAMQEAVARQFGRCMYAEPARRFPGGSRQHMHEFHWLGHTVGDIGKNHPGGIDDAVELGLGDKA